MPRQTSISSLLPTINLVIGSGKSISRYVKNCQSIYLNLVYVEHKNHGHEDRINHLNKKYCEVGVHVVEVEGDAEGVEAPGFVLDDHVALSDVLTDAVELVVHGSHCGLDF